MPKTTHENPKLPSARPSGSALVRRLRRQIKQRDELLEQFDRERRLMARLAADTPQFFNPLVVLHAKNIRDRILALPNDKVSEPPAH